MPTLDWIGKKAVLNHHNEVPYRLLRCNKELSVGDPGTGNLLVQGDNLEALKALLPYYAGKVKCIYIDPPFNTGKENWVYNDNVDSPEIRAWLGKVVGSEADDLCRHDKWLCMMYPRLALLRRMLADDGVVFISIGLDEVGNLRAISDDVFFRRNLVETFVWETEGHTENQEQVNNVHEYILCYAKDKQRYQFNAVVDPNVPAGSKIRRDFAENSITKNGSGNPPSEITLPVGFPCAAPALNLPPFDRRDEFQAAAASLGYITRALTKQFGVAYPVRLDAMVAENGLLAAPCRVFSGWMAAKKLQAFIDAGCQPIDDDGTTLRYFLSDKGVIYYRRENRTSRYVQTVLRNMGTTETNKYELESMNVDFDYPKPRQLIDYLVSLVCRPGDIVLDSFFGSGSTGHAVLLKPGVRFVGIELDEVNCRERARRRLKSVVDGYTFRGKAVPGTGGGFRFCELGPTLFDVEGRIQAEVSFLELARHVYFCETGEPLPVARNGKTPLLGVHNGTAVYLLYNGVLRDKTPDGGNVLTRQVLVALPSHDGPRVIYGNACRLGHRILRESAVTFRQVPYEIRTR